MTPITIHCSKLPRILKCPASLQAPDLSIIGPDDDSATLGSAAHNVAAQIVRGQEWSVDTTAQSYGVEARALAPLCFAARRIWEKYGPSLRVIAVEKRMSAEVLPGVILDGTADVLAEHVGADDPTLAVLDWKSGNAAGNHRDQLLGYAVLGRIEWSAAVKFTLIIGWLRDESIEVEQCHRDFGPDDLLERLAKVVEDNRNGKAAFAPSYESCRFCPRQIDCPARTALVRQSVADLEVVSGGSALATPADLARMYPRVKMLEKALKHYEATVRNAVAVAGKLPVGDGTFLTLAERPDTDIDAALALPILQKRFSLEELAPALTIGKGKLSAVVMQKSKRGFGSKNMKVLLDELAAGGALTISTAQVLKVVKE